VLKWPGQLVIAGCQTFWTSEVSAALEQGDLEGYVPTLLSQVRLPPPIDLIFYTVVVQILLSQMELNVFMQRCAYYYYYQQQQ